MELKPCPFCGGTAKLYERKDERPLERWYVECTGFGECDVFPHTYPATKLEAIEAWNTRAERTCRIRGGECDQCGAIVHEAASMTWVPVGEGMKTVEIRQVNYCPNCGAKVVGA